jgi:hypothetical protein
MEGYRMKKVILFVLGSLMVISTIAYAGVTENAEGGFTGSVTGKVDKLMATNQDAVRTYYPRDIHPNEFSIRGGFPLILGASYGYNINSYFQIGVGAGSFVPGITGDIFMKYYVLPSTITPYLGAGVTYVGFSSSGNIMAGHVEAGIDAALENGFGINLGLVYMKSFSDVTNPFDTYWGKTTKIDNAGLQAGLNFRF